MTKMKRYLYALLMGAACLVNAPAAEQKTLEEPEFREKFRGLEQERDDSEKHRRARDMIRMHRLTSLQVKAIAQRLRNDDARLEFATVAYPRTIDPENFYEVYDAFTTFSKVMRLHDRIRPQERSVPPVVDLPRILSNDEFKDIVKSVRRESFDNTRTQLARQILTSSRSLFLASQVKQLVECFDFEPSKLEMAKLAYEYTFDKEKYYLVNEAFDFDNTRQSLSRYVEGWNREHPPRH